MHLYKKAVKHNIEDLKNQLCKASGVNPQSSHRPHGFWGIISSNFGDIYVDDSIYSQLDDALKTDIEGCLDKIEKEDYGTVSEEEKDTNNENKYLGNGKNIIARYETSLGIVEINILDTHTMIKLI